MRILVTESEDYNSEALDVLRGLGDVICADFSDRASLLRNAANANVLVVRLRHRLDGELINAAPNLRVIASPTTGLDHIDLDTAASRGIAVLSLKGETEFLNGITATSELTWALLLELARRVGSAHRDVIEGRWNRDAWKGRGLKGRVLGILGYGRLGRIVASYGHAFRMPVLAHDPYVATYPNFVQAVSMEGLFARSDVLSVHVPLTAETKGLIGRKELGQLKHGAWLVNTSRGAIVDEAALLESLDSGRLGAAALDVLADETSLEGDWLAASPLRGYAESHDNLILTPHIGGGTTDAMAETELFLANKLRAHLKEAATTSPDNR